MSPSISLREYAAFDTERLAILANNLNVSKYLVFTFPYPYTKEDAAYWIEVGSKANNAITKVIDYQGNFVGSIGINPQSGWKAHSAEIGYWLGEEYCGLGVATSALKMMTDLAFAEWGYKKLYAPVLAPNKQSMKVLEKCCYVLEGILQKDVFKHGLYYDVHQFAKTHF